MTGWSFFNGDNIADPTVPLGEPRYVANLYATRLAGVSSQQTQEDIGIIVATYDLKPNVSLSEMLGNAIKDLQSVPQGSIGDALAKAYTYRGETGIISRKSTTRNDGTIVSELGAVIDGGGRLSYTTIFARPGGNFVYAIGIQLQFDKQANDSQYLQVYEQMLSTFRFID